MKIRTLVGSLIGSIVSVMLVAGCQTTEPVTVPEAPAPVSPPVATAPTAPVRQPVRPPSAATPTPTTPTPSVGTPVPSAPSTSSSSGTPGAVSNVPAGPDPRLADGIATYDLGDYNGAIRKLNIKELLESPSVDIQIEARKYLAFSYCVTRRAALCKQQFDAALKSKPSFDLKPIEAGHPSWGPVFKRAKADALKK